jgi:hypothetical protein
MNSDSLHETITPADISPSLLSDAIRRQRDALIDLDIAVDDARDAVDSAVETLHQAVSERDRIAVHLQHLCEWFVDVVESAA